MLELDINLVFTIIDVLILYFVLKKFLFGRVRKVMEERKNQDAFLVTGNLKYFPVERFIVTPRQFLDILLGK